MNSGKKQILITGINGQDGQFLAQILVKARHQIFGVDLQLAGPLIPGIEYIQGSIADTDFLTDLLLKIEPNEIYNLASVSQVSASFIIPEKTMAVNLMPVISMLELIRNKIPKTKLLQATSSEIFGGRGTPPFNEEALPDPLSPYAVSKEAAYHMVKLYRKAYNIFGANAILFNHTSPLHSSNFVIAKIIKELVEVKLGKRQKVQLGNLEIFRDWGSAEEYVAALLLIMNHTQPDDFVVGSGQCTSLREIVAYILRKLGLQYSDVIRINHKLFRKNDPKIIYSDPAKIAERLGWRSKKSFEEVLDGMIDAEMKTQHVKAK